MSTPQELMHAQFAQVFKIAALAWGDPAVAAARASASPQQTYVDMTTECPVKQLGDGMFRLTSMADIVAVTRNHDVVQGTTYLGSDRPAIPLGLDGPLHKQYRHMLDPVFTAKRIEPLGAQVRQLANELIDGFIAKGECDAFQDWCEPLPSIIFLSIMGLPLDQYENFHGFKNLILGNANVAAMTPEERLARSTEAVVWIQSYFNSNLDEREQEAAPRDDMIGWLLSAEFDGRRLSRTEMLDILGLLMIAGLDTVAASLGCFLSFLASHPDQRQRLLDDPTLTRSAIEELMRYESPVTEGTRVAKADIDLPSGVRVPAGSWMLISWSGANVDPAAFVDPLTVDFERKPNPHIGFASGFHRCLGSHLARLELSVALNVWHERIPHYRIAEGTELVYSGNPRAPHHLPLVWSA
ncbi:MAG: cytochrome P450 [Actinobacteria bacterium]|uniref:Unannotated protein n=1 Tax=freshwater metagenome TaxID=449393 RepID=A0A6J6RVU6_9ZZZZ|nr:cytochrome P450 [Actinomycetota bacterium]MSW77978.1 cytochrome P450 [Actinomycetota bacterium]MSX54238.1 cytochrome P450 [Actinomycetota bacterium]MSZ83266.1 cytochrome P450 [Actinomycetota bacterium]MTB18199.1 cytochrome P450 [Actinomycetota bacterium]